MYLERCIAYLVINPVYLGNILCIWRKNNTVYFVLHIVSGAGYCVYVVGNAMYLKRIRARWGD